MNEPQEQPPRNDDLVAAASEEIKGMAKGGMHHPSTKPVLVGAAAGAVAGFILPVIGPVIGGLAGAGIMLYKRLRP
ncbi:hypothetical protein [Tsuneonella sp. HG222]